MPAPSLKSRAVHYLSKREYSRAELARKLAQANYTDRRKAQAASLGQDDGNHAAHTPAPPVATTDEINAVLDDLERQGFLNDARFALSLVHRKAGKLGTSRMMQELGAHKLDTATSADLSAQLKSSELSRCHVAWTQRFAHKDLSELDYETAQAAKAKQIRFLTARGFAGDAIRKVMQGWMPDAD